MSRSLFASFFAFLLVQSAGFAQVTKITSPTGFSADSVKFDFQELQEDVQACEILARWGVTFQSVAGSVPTIGLVYASIGGAEPDRVLRNKPAAGSSSASIPLVVNFKYPVSRVGLYAGNGSASTRVTLKAYDPVGTNLGTVTEDNLEQEKYVGLSTTSVRGIAKLTIDYGTSQEVEQIDDLTFDFVSRPRFNTYLAQLGDADGLLQTILVISNLTNSTAQGEMRLFNSNGTPMQMKLGDRTNSRFSFSIPPFSTQNLPSPGTSNPLKVGYATIESNVPVDGTAIFRVVPGGVTVAEAGVGSAVARPFAVGVVQKVDAADFNTGVAVLNPSATTPSDARILLLDESGTVVAVNETDLDLPPGGHIPRFLGELFPEFVHKDFQGSVVITSDQPLVLVILRTLGGMPQSTLPVGSTLQ
jgi:hypothetical protein